jgi:hypothetical protein
VGREIEAMSLNVHLRSSCRCAASWYVQAKLHIAARDLCGAI